jgi:hypothetical protein
MLWGETGFERVCSSSKKMIDELAKLKPKIAEMISNKEISIETFQYPPYNNGCEVIP